MDCIIGICLHHLVLLRNESLVALSNKETKDVFFHVPINNDLVMDCLKEDVTFAWMSTDLCDQLVSMLFLSVILLQILDGLITLFRQIDIKVFTFQGRDVHTGYPVLESPSWYGIGK